MIFSFSTSKLVILINVLFCEYSNQILESVLFAISSRRNLLRKLSDQLILSERQQLVFFNTQIGEFWLLPEDERDVWMFSMNNLLRELPVCLQELNNL